MREGWLVEKKAIMNTIFLATLLYGCESWVLIEKTPQEDAISWNEIPKEQNKKWEYKGV